MPFRPRLQKHCAAQVLVFTAFAILLVALFSQTSFAQSAQVPPTIFKNYFVTGDYVVSGWVEQSSANGLATGTISIPDCRQAQAMGQQCAQTSPIPAGADIVAAYLYWATVEGNQTVFVGQQAFFNGYKIVGSVLGNPNAPTSWSSGGCTGSSTGSKTMRMYRADVRPFLPVDLNPATQTFGALVAQVVAQDGSVSPIKVQISDSGSNGNTQPNALGATLVLVYRVLSPATPLNAIVLYDGSYAPNNSQRTMSDTILGFYEPDSTHSAKLTQIVANGQVNKGETVLFGPDSLHLAKVQPQSLYTATYGANAPPFPGVYGMWDNPTWDVTSMVKGGPLGSGFDVQEITSVSPSSTNSGCANWGAIVFSTTVQDTDRDGLLDIWEQNQGYTDAVSNSQISLPSANANTKDLYVEVDYLALRDAQKNLLHSHLPKQQALDAVGNAFADASPPINVHFDLPAGIYQNDPYVISTAVGGNEISESALLCASSTNCAFPNQPSISWKGGFEAVKNDPTLGNFQPGRGQAYRYALFGHSLGEPRSYWGSIGAAFAASDPTGAAYTMTQLVSIKETARVATVTIESPTQLAKGVFPQVSPFIVKPGDCIQSANNPILPRSCFDPNGSLAANAGTVTISGAFLAPMVPASGNIPPQPGTPPLNGTYTFDPTSITVSGPDSTGLITTSFNIPTSNVPDGIYQFSCPSSPTNPPCFAEPQLGVSYLGPTSSSGHADFPGGGDLAVTFGLWGADNLPGCVLDPKDLQPGQVSCDDQVGTLKAQTGTLMHEMGHTLTLAHGGTYYQPNSSIPSYDLNCKPNHISVMNYLFQIRGFVDGTVAGQPPLNQFDFSGQQLPALNETTSATPPLDESQGVNAGQAAEHLTRWYSGAGPADNILNDKATAHCDGTPLILNEPAAYRVDGKLGPGGIIPAPLDFNNDLVIPDAISAAEGQPQGEDLNHNGVIGDSFQGFDDWANIDLQQMNARGSGFGFSDGGGLQLKGGGGLQLKGGGGVDNEGGGLQLKGGGGLQLKGGGGLQLKGGGGIEEDTENANSTVDAPSGLRCTTPLPLNGTLFPACTALSGGVYQEKAKAIPLSWSAPDFGQIRSYSVWRAIGSYSTRELVLANIAKFTRLTTINSGTPPTPSYVDNNNLKTNTTYTYFVTDTNSFSANSSASVPLVVLLK